MQELYTGGENNMCYPESTPLDDVETALGNASNALDEIPKGHYLRDALDMAIDGALRIVQTWKEEDAGTDGDYDAG